MGMMASAQITLMTLTYQGAARAESLPSVVDPSAARVKVDTASLPRQQMTLSMGMSAGHINGIQFTDHLHCCEAMSDVGGYEVWEVINASNMDHPFRHHVNAAQVLSIAGGDAKYASLYASASGLEGRHDRA